MPNAKTPFAQRLATERLTFRDVAFFTNISFERIKAHSKGNGTLTPAELDRIEHCLTEHRVIYTIWRRTAEVGDALKGVDIFTRRDGVMKVKNHYAPVKAEA